MKRTLVLLPWLVSACGGEVGVVTDGGHDDFDGAEFDVSVPLPESGADMGAGDASSDASVPDGRPTPNSQCASTQGVHATPGPNQGAVGCSSPDGGALQILKGYTWRSQQIAMDGANLYWVEQDGVVKADKTGVPVTKFCISAGSVDVMIEDASVLYVGTSNGSSHAILKIPTQGGNWTQVAAPTTWPVGLAADDTNIYWLEQDSQPVPNVTPPADGVRIGRVAKDGTGEGVLVTGKAIYGMASDGTDLYWLTLDASGNGGFGIFGMPLAGGPQRLVAQPPDNPVPTGFAMDGTSLYWTGMATVAAVARVVKDGSGLTQLATTNQSIAAGLEVEGSRAYWGECANGTYGNLVIHRMNTDGTAPVVLLTKQTAYDPPPKPTGAYTECVLDFASDATSLYFTTDIITSPGLLYRICK